MDRESKKSLFYKDSPSEQSFSDAEIRFLLYLRILNLLYIIDILSMNISRVFYQKMYGSLEQLV